MKSVCVFCGSGSGAEPAFTTAARALGTALAENGRSLVYGGARVGLMGAMADAALAAGGRVIGVIPRALVEMEVAHRGLTELRTVDSMHERKAQMADLAGAFVALPGGLGTLEEIFEVWTWAQLGLHRKPLGFLNVRDFYRPLLSFLDRLVALGFLRQEHREMVVVEDDPVTLLDRLAHHRPTPAPKLIGPRER
jgi:uncharacterized protein (TIGR00730 family)